LRIPPGISLLLIGSGLYWILSSQLISSFTVFSPGLFETLPAGQKLITVVGTISLTSGLWTVSIDIDEFRRLATIRNGYVFILPIVFVALDMYSTLINLSLNSRTAELNPLVASIIQYGPGAVAPFLVSYIALSQGLALFMLRIGAWLFERPRALRILPFAVVCSASSFGSLSNLLGLVLGYHTLLVYLIAITGSMALGSVILRVVRGAIALSLLTTQ